jgi:replicative DNA helicase
MADSRDVEYELIGSILKDGKIFPRVAEIVSAENFQQTICQDIYKAMDALHDAGMGIDQVTVGDQLQRNGSLSTIIHETFAGRPALGKIRELGSPKNADSYANIVKDYWGKRAINEFLPKVAYWAQNGRRSIDIIADMRTEFDRLDIGVGELSVSSATSKEAASRSYDETVNASKGLIKFAQFGFPDLDFLKMRHGTLSLIGGRPGDGKTAMLVTVALYNSLNGRDVVFFSLEMTVEELTARFLSQISNIPASRIMDGKMSAEEWGRYNDAVAVFEKLPIMLNDRPAITVSQFRQEARRLLKSGNDSLICVDYIQLMSSGQKNQNRNDEIGVISRKLKEFSKSLPNRPPILSAVQLSRAVEQRASKRPILADLRESGSLEQDADNVIFIYNESDDELKSNQRELIVAKQRNGPVGSANVIYEEKTMKFSNGRVFAPNMPYKDNE